MTEDLPQCVQYDINVALGLGILASNPDPQAWHLSAIVAHRRFMCNVTYQSVLQKAW